MNRTFHAAVKAAVGLSLLLLMSCPNPLMNAIIAKEAADTSKSINSFSFMAAANAKVYTDIAGVVDDTARTVALTVPKWVPLTNLVATFQFQGASVSVNGVAQTSGVTANDFTHPVTFTITPATGTPVSYTVTAATGTRGLMGGVIQGAPLSLSGTVTTFAGLASPFGDPMGVVRSGNYLYLADPQFSVIWQVNVGSGVAAVFAGQLGNPGYAEGTGTAAQFDSPQGLATDGTYLYVADEFNERIREITLSGAVVSTLTGTTVGNADGGSSTAKFNGPLGLYLDSPNNLLYETDKFNKTVRTIDVSGTASRGNVTTLTLSANPFAAPAGLTLYNNGVTTNLYVCDATNNAIYAFGPVPTYTESTFSTGGSNGFNAPLDVVVYNSFLYVTDSGNHVIEKVDPANGSTVTTIMGSYGTFGHVDGVDASSLRFDTPNMLTVQTGSTNYMYITESGNTDVRSVTLNTNPASDIGATVAGVYPGSSNGTGNAARFYSPRQMATNGTTLWVGDQLNQLLRSLSLATAAVGTLAGQLGNANDIDGTGSGAAFNYPAGMTTDGKFLYVCDQYADTIRKVDITTGAVTTIAGGAQGWFDATGTTARFNRPVGITTDGKSLFVVDLNNNDIRKVDLASLAVTTFAGSLTQVAGSSNGTGTGALLNLPNAITTDGTNLFVVESQNQDVRQIVISSGVVTTLAGAGTAGYVNNSVGTSAKFRFPIGITTDGTSLYVADVNNGVIRKIDIASGAVSTLAGAPQPTVTPPSVSILPEGEIDGSASTARFNDPIGIVTDGVSLYVSDRASNVIRRIQ